jgi:hypothetical protein
MKSVKAFFVECCEEIKGTGSRIKSGMTGNGGGSSVFRMKGLISLPQSSHQGRKDVSLGRWGKISPLVKCD